MRWSTIHVKICPSKDCYLQFQTCIAQGHNTYLQVSKRSYLFSHICGEAARAPLQLYCGVCCAGSSLRHEALLKALLLCSSVCTVISINSIHDCCRRFSRDAMVVQKLLLPKHASLVPSACRIYHSPSVPQHVLLEVCLSTLMTAIFLAVCSAKTDRPTPAYHMTGHVPTGSCS